MKEENEATVPQVSELPDMIYRHFRDHGKASYVHVEILMVIYRWYPEYRSKCAGVLWQLFLVNFTNKARITTHKFHIIYYTDDILHNWFFKFLTKLDDYYLPCEAPFAGYINRYCYLWMNAYCKLESNHGNRFFNELDDNRNSNDRG